MNQSGHEKTDFDVWGQKAPPKQQSGGRKRPQNVKVGAKSAPTIWTRQMVLCQDLVQVKMRNFSHFNPPEAQPQCVFFYTIVRIHLVTYSYNGYEFVSYCRKLPDIRKSSGMPACNREF